MEMADDKRQVTEDSRFLIFAYCIVKSANISQIFKVFKVAENFVEYEDFEDAAAISTLHSAFEIIIFEYSKLLIQSQRSTMQRNLAQVGGSMMIQNPDFKPDLNVEEDDSFDPVHHDFELVEPPNSSIRPS